MSGNNKRILIGFAVMAALGFASAAQAQYVVQYSDGLGGYGYRAEPLYPYAPQPQIIYPQQSSPRAYPYVRSPQANAAAKPVSKTDPALVEELRKRARKHAEKAEKARKDDDDKIVEGKKIKRTIVVREKPVVRERIRVVDDPPIIVQREVGEEQPAPPPGRAEHAPSGNRVIRAEAEVTIIGPDRMSIRLFRKNDGGDANAKVSSKAEAKADTKKSKIR